MKKITTGILALAAIISIVGLTSARAEEMRDGGKGHPLKAMEKMMERLDKFEIPRVESSASRAASMAISPEGKIHINNAEVTSVASSTLGLKVWGIMFSVDITQANFLPEGTKLSDIKSGDKVNVQGSVNTSGMVTAQKVHALSFRNRASDSIRAQIEELLARLKTLQQRYNGLGSSTTSH